MRLSKCLWTGLCLGLFLRGLGGVAAGQQGGRAEEIVARYHFVGCRQLAGNTNFGNLEKVFAAPPSKEFVDLVLDRMSASIAKSIAFKPNFEADSLVRPLLDDLTATESVGAFAGRASSPLGFVLAVQLDNSRAALWQTNIGKEFATAGAQFQAEGSPGMRWSRGALALWVVRANGWLLAGSGEELVHLRSEYLQQIKQHGRPEPALKDSWLEADIDWPKLVHWLPDASLPLKPARTKINFATRHESIRVTAQVTYPENIAWQGHPWRIPTNLVFDPLISFTATVDIEPFLKPIPQAWHLEGYPFTGQFFVWALGEMPFQTYTAWPVDNASNVLQHLSTEAPVAMNPDLKKFNGSRVAWAAKEQELVWTGNPMIGPNLGVPPQEQGRFLMAGLFPFTTEKNLAPQALWEQFKDRTDLVFYDWELSGPRLQQWRLLSQLLPLIPASEPMNPSFSKSQSTGRPRPLAGTIEENFLAALAQMIGVAETATEISRSGPNQLTLVRRSPTGLSSIETVLLSHWLTGAGAGPVDMGLLPRAKVSGPGAGH